MFVAKLHTVDIVATLKHVFTRVNGVLPAPHIPVLHQYKRICKACLQLIKTVFALALYLLYLNVRAKDDLFKIDS